MDKQEENELLNTLKSIDGTLKRIEQSLVAERQAEYIYNAVSKALTGEKKHNCNCGKSEFTSLQKNEGDAETTETRENKEKRLENALLEYIEKHAKDAPPGIAATIPAAAMALVELWKII